MPVQTNILTQNGCSSRVSWLSTANETIVVLGNNTVSNLAISYENVQSASIASIYWSGNVTLSRGANLVANLSGSGYWPLMERGMPLYSGNTANIVITVTGTCYLEIIKDC